MKPGSITVHPGTPNSYSIHLLENRTLSIGRKAQNGDESRLVLPSPEVSSQHAEIRYKSGSWTIVDSGSTNGTIVNGVRLTAGREHPLKNADIVTIAEYQLLVTLPLDAPTKDAYESDQGNTQFHIDLINATILVGDIKDFTTLMEAFAANPSEVMQAAGRVFEMLNKEISKNFGQLEKIAGDAIMAYWHSGETQSDVSVSAYQACLTALLLKESTQRLAKEKDFWPFQNHPLLLDMALATGPVASGALGRSQGNPAILGDTANLAFRLEKLIGDERAGCIVVESRTYELVKEHFRFEELGEFSVKGRQRPVSLYQLVGTVAAQ
jgi:class 3 adenylate cyclase